MASPGTPVSVLFADICDSTPLYETSGDAPALAVIARRLDELAHHASSYGGEVIRSKGDDVLCTFAEPSRALHAAARMLESQAPGVLPIRVGVHFGEVISAREDIFGDAVNVAARMLSLAKPGELVTSSEFAYALTAADRARLSLLGPQLIKGKQEPVSVYSMVLDHGEHTQVVWEHAAAGARAPDQTVQSALEVVLEFRGRQLAVRDGSPCLLGRAERCDLVIDDLCVSREHARVEVHPGSARLIDQSSTGSWLLDPDGGHRTLRRDSAPLSGSGTIRLGRHPRDATPAPEVFFRLREVL